MVVRFDLEDGGKPVTDVDGARILSRALQDSRTVGRQFLQVNPRALVAAVLGPHHRKNSKLRQRRFASQRLDDAIVFVGGKPVPFQQRGVDGTHGAAVLIRPPAATWDSTDSNSTRPSALPSIDSQARSGCGISPTTLRAALQMPAMLLTAPFGFAASVTAPVASQ